MGVTAAQRAPRQVSLPGEHDGPRAHLAGARNQPRAGTALVVGDGGRSKISPPRCSTARASRARAARGGSSRSAGCRGRSGARDPDAPRGLLRVEQPETVLQAQVRRDS